MAIVASVVKLPVLLEQQDKTRFTKNYEKTVNHGEKMTPKSGTRVSTAAAASLALRLVVNKNMQILRRMLLDGSTLYLYK